ncbi:MAG: hypothetical protein ABJE95_19895 [Byssovorax sp.]
MKRCCLSLSLSFACLALVGLGCVGQVESGDAPPSLPIGAEPASTTWRGTLAGKSGESGVVDVVIASATGQAKQTAHAHIRFIGGAEAALTGAIDEKCGALTLSNADYAFHGTLSKNVMTGTFSVGKSMGAFSAIRADGAEPVVYCGTYDGPFKGTWNLVIAEDGTVTGSNAGDAIGGVTGQRDGDALVLQHDTGGATGTIAGTSVEGTFDIGGSPGGTWAGSVEGCQ